MAAALVELNKRVLEGELIIDTERGMCSGVCKGHAVYNKSGCKSERGFVISSGLVISSLCWVTLRSARATGSLNPHVLFKRNDRS